MFSLFRAAFGALLALSAMVPLATPLAAAEINVAVAANFTEPVKEIAKAFEARTGHKVVLSFGASGPFYTQITQDAPFTIFLSADDERPRMAVENGFGVKGSVFTYAVGKLVLWSHSPGVTASEETLRAGKFAKLALANPKAAPYGVAASQVLAKLRLEDTLKDKIVQGATIAQTYQFVETGNADLGFVALSQIIKKNEGSSWIVPETLYDPIRQDAVLLKKGADDPAAKAFLDFLKGPEALAVIKSFGYGVGAAG